MPDMEILVLGDGAFVHAVLNGVASINSYGKLGALGMLVGIILMGVKGAAAPGGPKLDPSWMLISIALFWVMFIPRVDRVMVTEVMIQPGNVAPRTFVVDNVPLGLASAGYIMSNTAVKLTNLYETSFGSATDVARGTTGGLGKNLMLLSSLRTMVSNKNFTDSAASPTQAGFISRFNQNMGYFLSDCVYPLVNNGVLNKHAVMTSPGLTGVLNEETAHAIRTTRWRETSGISGATCKQAKERLEANSQNAELLTSFDEAMKLAGVEGSHKDIQMAFGSFTNERAMSMQTMVATAMMNAVAAEAAVRGSLSPADSQSIIMVEEASMRRNVQWAGEESLFIRILRPIIGFFEALFYALGPIMAMVVGLGPFGWSLVGKYMMLTLWVGLWFPMLAITQLYSNIKMQYFFDRLGGDGDFSPMQLNQIATQAMDELGAASALTAATPALAMSLLYGGAVSMSYLAGRLQGSDMIDESKVAPSASTVSAVASQSVGAVGTMGTGTTAGGYATPKLDIAQSADASKRSFESYNAQQSKEFSQGLERVVSESHGTAITGSHIENSSQMSSFTDKIGEALRASAGKSAAHQQAYDAYSRLDKAAQNQLAASAYVAGSVSAGVKVPGLGGAEVSAGTELRGTTSRTGSAGIGEQDSEKVSMAINQALASDKSLAAEGAVALSHAVQDGYGKTWSSSTGATDAEKLSSTAKEVYSSAVGYEAAVGLSERFGMSESLGYDQVSQNFMNNYSSQPGGVSGAVAHYRDSIASMGGDGLTEVDNLASSLSQNSGLSPEAAQVAAIGMYLQRGNGIPADMQDERAALMNSYLSASTSTGGMFAGSGALGGGGMWERGGSTKETVVQEVEAAGSVQQAAGGISGPSASYGSVVGGTRAGLASAAGAVGTGQASVDGNVNSLGSRERGQFERDANAEVNEVYEAKNSEARSGSPMR